MMSGARARSRPCAGDAAPPSARRSRAGRLPRRGRLRDSGCRSRRARRGRARASARAASQRGGAPRSAGISSGWRSSISSRVSRRCLLHQVDQAEVPRAEHDDLASPTSFFLGFCSAAPRSPRRRRGPPSAPARLRLRSRRRVLPERALDEVVEPVAVALLERRALRLAVIGEDDDLVRSRRIPAAHGRCARTARRACAAPRACRRARARSGGRPRRSSRTSRRRRAGRASCP